MPNETIAVTAALLSALFATSLAMATPAAPQTQSHNQALAHGEGDSAGHNDVDNDHSVARPYDPQRDAMADVEAALSRAKGRGVNTIIVMGANWCHDSHGLAGHLASARFHDLLRANYEVVYVDIGVPQDGKGRNLDVAARFGVTDISGTPNVLVISPNGTLLNTPDDARSWRDADSRDADDVYDYFAGYSAD